MSTLGGSVELSTPAPAPASTTFDQALKVGQWDNDPSGHSDDVTADDYVVNERSQLQHGPVWVHLSVVCCPGGANIKRFDAIPVDDELLG